jgi:DeoR family transcriptional regulator, aga operon transcriptional repressor
VTATTAPEAASHKRSVRMLAILRLLGDNGSLRLAELTDTLGVSAATIRRDLTALSDQGLLVRTHGGARAPVRTEVPIHLRDCESREAKQRIAAHAVSLLPSGPYSIALSGGTTAAEVARALTSRKELAVITNALTTVMEIASRPDLKVIITGGVVRPSSFEAVGALAENTFSSVNVGTAILGTDGISVTGGATTHDETEARTNHAMVTHAQRVMVVADGSKVGRITLARMAELNEIDVLVTDTTADRDELDRIAAAGVEVHVVD